ncbi:MAG: beta-glycosidase, partial [Muribaculaceae bacterium]|nr:beta-glycosidase [Muribaculaceae bacterium]
SQVILDWVEKPKSGSIEFSDDNATWTSVAPLPESAALSDTVSASGKARYVRVMMTEPGESGRYVLSELQVMGRGGVSAVAHEIAGDAEHNGKKEYSLNGGAWRLARASEVSGSGEQISSPGFDDSSWIVATVPATVLSSYMNIGAVPDPNFSDNLFCISESYFNSNFWYRTEFDYHAADGERVFLNFDGINWKADVYLNGKRIDRIEGAFVRSKVDVTDMLKQGTNVLAVEIEKVAHPGAVKEKNIDTTDFNGGMLGLDNPTFHATIGWDWISTVRGRDIGIWNDVYLTTATDVTILDPVVTTTLTFGADTLASMTPCVIVANHAMKEVNGTLRGWIGNIEFSREVTLGIGEETEICFTPDEFAGLKDQKMNLWWPVGYGKPHLYAAGYEFIVDGKVADAIDYKAGIREMTYADPMTRLMLYVNGKRFIPLGGNWGFSEHNLNYRGREYDIAVKYHKDMNFNMIRNWVGQTGDEEFYEACDRHGVMVMQDFWLANPVDGPNPGDEAMFLNNAEDYVKRIRRHPSIAFYCGRNEGDPTPTLNAALKDIVAEWNPGILYIPNSADYGLTGHGPYGAEPDSVYFKIQTGKFHSERGLPNVMTPEGLERTFGKNIPWPQDNLWGQHDYTQKGAQRGASFNRILDGKLGMPDNGAEFGKLAQWENYDAYRAMFESAQTERMGLVIWMSHSCWPSLTWDTYDYYFEPTAAFFGSKKACEPLHVQWNPVTRYVQVVNVASGTHDNLTVEAEVLDVNGKVVDSRSAAVVSKSDTTEELFTIAPPADMVAPLFLRLTLKEGDATVSENTYGWGTPTDGLKALLHLPDAAVEIAAIETGPTSREVTLKNTGSTVVPLVRLNLKGTDGEQILPVDYSDNYFHLMPGESRTVEVAWNEADARGSDVVVETSAINLKPVTAAF